MQASRGVLLACCLLTLVSDLVNAGADEPQGEKCSLNLPFGQLLPPPVTFDDISAQGYEAIGRSLVPLKIAHASGNCTLNAKTRSAAYFCIPTGMPNGQPAPLSGSRNRARTTQINFDNGAVGVLHALSDLANLHFPELTVNNTVALLTQASWPRMFCRLRFHIFSRGNITVAAVEGGNDTAAVPSCDRGGRRVQDVPEDTADEAVSFLYLMRRALEAAERLVLKVLQLFTTVLTTAAKPAASEATGAGQRGLPLQASFERRALDNPILVEIRCDQRADDASADESCGLMVVDVKREPDVGLFIIAFAAAAVWAAPDLIERIESHRVRNGVLLGIAVLAGTVIVTAVSLFTIISAAGSGTAWLTGHRHVGSVAVGIGAMPTIERLLVFGWESILTTDVRSAALWVCLAIPSAVSYWYLRFDINIASSSRGRPAATANAPAAPADPNDIKRDEVVTLVAWCTRATYLGLGYAAVHRNPEGAVVLLLAAPQLPNVVTALRKAFATLTSDQQAVAPLAP